MDKYMFMRVYMNAYVWVYIYQFLFIRLDAGKLRIYYITCKK